MRLTQKNEIFEYVLPEQNTIGDNQATEISLGETEYTCKKYIIGEAINKLGELEDVLESWHIENLEELKTRLNDCQVYHLKNNSNETLIHNLKNELAELKQKAIVPKFSLGQTCFIIWENDIISARIEKIIMKLSKDEEENSIFYSITNQYGYALRFPEEQIFATKEEAEQSLLNALEDK